MGIDVSNMAGTVTGGLYLSDGALVLTWARTFDDASPLTRAFPWLGQVRIKCQTQDADGFPLPDEHQALNKVLDVAEAALDPQSVVIMGRISTRGLRTFYFYVADPAGFFRAVRGSLCRFSDYETQVECQEDSAWLFYYEKIAPLDNYNVQRSRTEALLETLQSQGDDLKESRDIDHTAYFPTDESRNQFSKWATERGFTVRFAGEKMSGSYWYSKQLSYWINVVRCEIPDWKFLRGTMYDLAFAAAKFSGHFDGSACFPHRA